MIAAITGSVLLTVIVWIAVAAVVWYLGNWAIQKLGLGEPFSKVANVVLVLAVLIIVVNALLLLVGRPIF